MTNSEKRLNAPPYSRHPDIAYADLVIIYCGRHAWELAKPGEVVDSNDWSYHPAKVPRAPSLVYPYGHDPGKYSWPVKDRQVLVMAMGELRTVTDPLVMELLHQGARCVAVREGEGLTYYDLLDRA